ncbi:MAG: response regulator [Deltaproteobacteria bacterium]|nr:response regulator [Deltaproteobacteria bacterium]
MNALQEIINVEKTIHPHILIMEDDLNVAKAMDAMGKHDYDLLMADLRLPDIDGMQVVKQLKETKPDTEVIVMTGYATSDLAVNAMKLGAHDFITKPFTEEQIKSAIKEALDQNTSKSNRENLSSVNLENNTSIQKREVLKVLNRTSEDEKFWINLMEEGSSALSDYTLSSEAKAAIASGDLQWINENIGELTQKQLMFIYKRLEREAW